MDSINDSFNESVLVASKARKTKAIIDTDSEEEDERNSNNNSNKIIDSFESSNVGEGDDSVFEDSFIEEKKTDLSKVVYSTSITDDEDVISTDDEGAASILSPRFDMKKNKQMSKSEKVNKNSSNDLNHSDYDEENHDFPSSDSNNSKNNSDILEDIIHNNEKSTPDRENDVSKHEESDLKLLSNANSIVEVSSEDEELLPIPLHSSTFLEKAGSSQVNVPLPITVKQVNSVFANLGNGIATNSTKIKVEKDKYQEQLKKINSIESDLLRATNVRRIIKLESLPDKGKSLLDKEKSLNMELQKQKEILKNMEIDESQPQSVKNKIGIAWDEIEAGVDAVGPRTFGKKGVERFKAERNMAMETLDEIHKSLAACPTDNDLAEDPPGLKIPLMPHQRRALKWLVWRESQKPSGGILADDMGLGKTLTMISLVVKSLQLEKDQDIDKENYRDKYPGGTLVVCPASLLNQWTGEVEKRTKRGLISVEVYHGPKRETKPKRLARPDLVVTTYSIILNEVDKRGTVFGVRWRRIILDEAHQIRNHKARTSEAIFNLSGKSRWALTGTPIHNKELDLYSLLKFLRCSPFDDLQVWKHWVSDKSTGGETRLHAVTSSLMLRRTKAELMGNGVLQSLPERKWELVSVNLDKDEMGVYQKILIFSRTLFAQFLHQRSERNQDAVDFKFNGAPPDPNGEYFKMRNKLLKLNKVKEVSQHDILLLLLRLRQICCHPFLITKMLQGDEDLGDADDDDDVEELNLLEQLNKLDLNEKEDHAEGVSENGVGLKEASKGYLNPSNPVFLEERRSSKMKILIKLVKEKIINGDKAIIVSQWATLLRLVGIQLKQERIIYDTLDGSIPINKRMPIVDNFNDQKSNTRVLLLSLTAGGVGLNLIGANHLFLLDLHWNPQLENQAQDRIYRMGQTKPIFVYKFMATQTIEERIKMLQDKKLDLANSVLTGSKRVSNTKLTLQDLKLLFDFK